MNTEKLQRLRQDYSASDLDEKQVDPDPIKQFMQWMDEALNSEIPEPNAMTLSTVDEEGQPHSRTVLLKGVDKDDFVFYTNYGSDKGSDLNHNPKVSLCFLWLELERQVIIDGTAEKLTEEENNDYFKVRPYKSQIGALASNQSEIVENRDYLEDKFQQLEQQYAEGEVPKPVSWGGYRVHPKTIEFWQGRRSRLHDRIKYFSEDNSWTIKRLSP